jgi:urease accessory protein
MFDVHTALTLMHFGDSAFPAGGFAFSWGIEGLIADGMIAGRQSLDDFVADHLCFRWNSMDRRLLAQAFRAGGDPNTVAAIDHYAEASTPCAQMRDGSRRAGRALLGVSARLGGPLSVRYRSMSFADPLLGHLPVTEAVAYRDAGLDLRAAELVSGWTLVHALVGAAVRLGNVGHIEAQQSLASARAVLAGLVAETVPEDAVPSSFTPLIDIAVSRGQIRHLRMFTT